MLQAAARGGPSRRGRRSYGGQDALYGALAFYQAQCGNQCLHACGANFGLSFHTSSAGWPGRLWVNMRRAWLHWMSSSAPIRVGAVMGAAVLVAMFSIAACAYGASASGVFGIFFLPGARGSRLCSRQDFSDWHLGPSFGEQWQWTDAAWLAGSHAGAAG